jgi:hypothetical protein
MISPFAAVASRTRDIAAMASGFVEIGRLDGVVMGPDDRHDELVSYLSGFGCRVAALAAGYRLPGQPRVGRLHPGFTLLRAWPAPGRRRGARSR